MKIVSHHGLFSPLNPTLRKYPIVGFDSEDDTRGTPISFAFHTGEKSFYTRHVGKALDYVYNLSETSIIVAHNLEYDIGNLFKACEYKYVDELIYSSKLLKVTLIGTKNYFLNSSSFFQGNLAALGKIVGIDKLDGTSLDKKYNIRDAHIPQVFMSGMQDRLHGYGINLGVSLGQIAINTYRAKFMKRPIVTFNHPLCREAYFGGRVEMFYKGVVKEKVFVADIKSSYPDVMRHYTYPDTEVIEPSRLATHRFGVGKFKIHVPENIFVPLLPYRTPEGRLFFPTGDFEGTYTYAEIRKAVEIGCKILKEYTGVGTNIEARPFGDFIDHFWKKRQEAESKFDSIFIKLIMNNLYGKFSQWRDLNTVTRIPFSEKKLQENSGTLESIIGPFYSYKIPRKEPPRTANYMWGTYITSYARISLYEKIETVRKNGGRLLYCDTDSVMFTGKAALAALNIGDNLGQMSLESYDLAVFRQSKGYLLCAKAPGKKDAYVVKKLACKGVPSAYGHDFIMKGLATFQKPMRLKEAEIRLSAEVNKGKNLKKEIGVNIWRDVSKVMRGIYIKRKGADGITQPVNVNEIEELERTAYGDDAFSVAALGESVILEPKAKQDAEKKRKVFRDVVIPENWFAGENEKPRKHGAISKTPAQKLHFFKSRECRTLAAGDTWFRGVIISHEKGKFGYYFKIFVKEYMGESAEYKNMVGAAPVRFFAKFEDEYDTVEKYIGKTVEIILNENYDSKCSLDVQVNLI